MIRFATLFALVLLSVPASLLPAQSTNSGTVHGVVLDPSGAAVPGATVMLNNPIRQFSRTVQTNRQGQFQFGNLPFDSFTLIAQSPKFHPAVQPVAVQSTVPVRGSLKLALAGSSTTVTVEAAGATAPTLSPTAQTNVDRAVITEMPTRSIGSGLSDLITYSSPSVAADSNGFFHPLGDHAEQTFVIDGQPISDQQSKLFSTSLPANAIESLDLITAAPSAEYGDKTSMVVEATTRSGLGASPPTAAWTPTTAPSALPARIPRSASAPLIGETSSRSTASAPAASWTPRSSLPFTILATTAKSSTEWTFSPTPTTASISTCWEPAIGFKSPTRLTSWARARTSANA